MLAIAEPSARLKLVCTRSRRALRTAASVSGSSTSSAITTPTADCGAPIASTASSIAGDSIFASPTTATSATQQQPEADERRRGSSAARRAPRRRPPSRRRAGSSRGGGRSGRTRTARRARARRRPRTRAARDENSGPGRLVVNVGSTRRERRQRRHGGERGRRALGVERRRRASRSAPTSSEMPDDAVAGDHHGGEHRVARQRRRVPCRADTISVTISADLDHRHRDGEHERAERLADPVRDDLGVVDRRQHRAGQEHADEREHHAPAACAPTSAPARARERRDRDRPAGEGQAPHEAHGGCVT